MHTMMWVSSLRRAGAPLFAMAMALWMPAAQAEVEVAYSGPPVAIPDNVPEGVNVSVSVAGLQAITDLNFRMQGALGCSGALGDTNAAVTHPFVGDLVMSLTSPQGTTVLLFDRRGGTRDNICDLLLDDDGNLPSLATIVAVTSQPISGQYLPEQPLSAFDGESPNGVWTLNISDRAQIDAGTLRRFSLVLDTVPIDIVVDDVGDPSPATCVPGSCSLREAVQLANAQPGPNRIVLAVGAYSLTRFGAGEDANSTGDLDITDDLLIVGAGAALTTLTQTVADRLLHAVPSGADLTLRDLTLSGGSAVDRGGALFMPNSARLLVERVTFSGNRANQRGGAIHHNGSGAQRIVMRNCRFEDNRVINTDVNDAYGGALYSASSGFNDDYLRIENCTFVNNRADNGGGALALDGVQSVSGNRMAIVGSEFTQNLVTVTGRGGAIGTNLGEIGVVYVDVSTSTFSQNGVPTFVASGEGGAMSIFSGIATVRGSVLTQNSAYRGGAIFGEVELIETSTLCANTAVVQGGGVSLGATTATISRNTFCNNSVSTSDTAQVGGGAIDKQAGNLTLDRNTLDGNVAVRGAGLAFGGDDLVLRNNTIVAPSPLPAGALGSVMRYTNAQASDTMFFFNNILIGQCSWSTALNPGSSLSNIEASGNTCRLLLAPLQSGNQVAVSGSSINLATLANNGGPTNTRLPQAPSIAINTAANTGCPTLDQRGYQRNDPQCDVGSVEVGGTLPPEQMFANGFE